MSAEQRIDDYNAMTDPMAGAAGEHLVCVDALLQGHQAFLSASACLYDVVIDVGSRLVRVQVKSTRAPRAIAQRSRREVAAYMWHIRRRGYSGSRVYDEADFDLLALVALDVQRIAYVPPSRSAQTFHIRPINAPPLVSQRSGIKRGKDFDDYPLADALETLR